MMQKRHQRRQEREEMDQKIVKPFGNLVFEQKWVICTALSKNCGLSGLVFENPGRFTCTKTQISLKKIRVADGHSYSLTET